VLAQLEVPVPAVVAALRLARAAGARTVLNPAPARRLPAELLVLCDVIVPNEHEASVLSGCAAPSEAVAAIATWVPGAVVIVTCGADGALVQVPGSPPAVLPAIPAKAVDSVAAGDAFCGVLAASLAQGRRIAEAVSRATAAGAHAVGLAGALPSLPWAADIDRLLGPS